MTDGADLRVIDEFPTTSGMRVELAEAGDGRRYVIKSCRDATKRPQLAAQVRQMRTLAGLVPSSVFPRVIQATGARLVMEYVPGSTLRDIAPATAPGTLADRLADCVGLVFGLAATPAGPPPCGRGFLAAEIASRAERVAAALGRADLGTAGYRSIDRVCAAADTWDAPLAPPHLGLGAHGDLTPQNVVFTPGTGRTTLIDPRGLVRWQHGRPWWDPAFDLAAMVAFHAVVDRIAELDSADRAADRVRAVFADLATRCADDPRVVAWAADDPTWRERARLAVFVRLLGNVSVQLAHFPDDGPRRARVLLDTCTALADDLSGDLDELRSAA